MTETYRKAKTLLQSFSKLDSKTLARSFVLSTVSESFVHYCSQNKFLLLNNVCVQVVVFGSTMKEHDHPKQRSAETFSA